jgi:hypothetical protein
MVLSLIIKSLNPFYSLFPEYCLLYLVYIIVWDWVIVGFNPATKYTYFLFLAGGMLMATLLNDMNIYLRR